MIPKTVRRTRIKLENIERQSTFDFVLRSFFVVVHEDSEIHECLRTVRADRNGWHGYVSFSQSVEDAEAAAVPSRWLRMRRLNILRQAALVDAVFFSSPINSSILERNQPQWSSVLDIFFSENVELLSFSVIEILQCCWNLTGNVSRIETKASLQQLLQHYN
mgnify:CR=1 FL=1